MSKITFYLDEVENVLNKRHQAPVCAEVDPSNYCNNGCTFCCFSNYIKSNQEHLSLSLFQKFVQEFHAMGGKAITFTGGGEPLMNPNFLKMAIYAREHGIKIGLVTNGSLLGRLQGFENFFRFIRISLNAPNKELYYKLHQADHFDDIVKNIKRILALNVRPHLGISVVLCDENREHAEETVELGKQLGVDYVQIKPDIYNKDLTDVAGETEGIKITCPLHKAEEFGMLPCAIAGLTFILSATGDVYYCCVQRGNPDFRLGNIRNFNLCDFIKIRERFSPDLTQCTTCRYTSYAKEYEKYKGNAFIFLRHKEFL